MDNSRFFKNKNEKRLYQKIINQEATIPQLKNSLKKLTEYFYQQFFLT